MRILPAQRSPSRHVLFTRMGIVSESTSARVQRLKCRYLKGGFAAGKLPGGAVLSAQDICVRLAVSRLAALGANAEIEAVFGLPEPQAIT